MKIVLLRVGIDTGCGGIHSPLFKDGTFEFVPIPDDRSLDDRTYGNTIGRHGRALLEYFPNQRRPFMADRSIHVDPEFTTFTYGDPTTPTRRLRELEPGDLLVLYAGLEGWDFQMDPALYLIGFFEVEVAGIASEIDDAMLRPFANNFHVRHGDLFREQRHTLVLVRGTHCSRLFRKAYKLGQTERLSSGKPWQIISADMAKIFGRFGGIGSIQRSNPRWVDRDHIDSANKFIRSLR